MNGQDREEYLSAALRMLAEDLQNQEPSPSVRQALEREVRAVARRRRLWKRLLPAVAAAVVILGLFLHASLRRRPADQPATAQVVHEFLAVPGAPRVTDGFSHVIRVRLPRTEMRRFGFPVREGSLPSLVEADVLVGRDGLARAVRFVPVAESQ
jgi:hypothetical protein